VNCGVCAFQTEQQAKKLLSLPPTYLFKKWLDFWFSWISWFWMGGWYQYMRWIIIHILELLSSKQSSTNYNQIQFHTKITIKSDSTLKLQYIIKITHKYNPSQWALLGLMQSGFTPETSTGTEASICHSWYLVTNMNKLWDKTKPNKLMTPPAVPHWPWDR
jgi:hypothetical protein